MKWGLQYTLALSASPAADLFPSTGDGGIISDLVSGKSMNEHRKLVSTAREGNKLTSSQRDNTIQDTPLKGNRISTDLMKIRSWVDRDPNECRH